MINEKRDELNEFRRDPNKATAGMYTECRPKFIRWGRENHSLGPHDLADIFQSAIVILVLNIESGRLTGLVGTLCTYLFGIGKKLIQAFLRKNRRVLIPGGENIPQTTETDPGAETQMIEKQDNDDLWAKVNALGEPCRSILILTYKEAMSSQEIAEVLGYASPDVVRQIRKRCIDRLRKN